MTGSAVANDIKGSSMPLRIHSHNHFIEFILKNNEHSPENGRR